MDVLLLRHLSYVISVTSSCTGRRCVLHGTCTLIGLAIFGSPIDLRSIGLAIDLRSIGLAIDLTDRSSIDPSIDRLTDRASMDRPSDRSSIHPRLSINAFLSLQFCYTGVRDFDTVTSPFSVAFLFYTGGMTSQ